MLETCKIVINRNYSVPKDTLVITGGTLNNLTNDQVEAVSRLIQGFVAENSRQVKPSIYYENIRALEMPVRLTNALLARNINRVEELINHSAESLMVIPQIAKGSIEVIEKALAVYGLKLAKL